MAHRGRRKRTLSFLIMVTGIGPLLIANGLPVHDKWGLVLFAIGTALAFFGMGMWYGSR